MSFQHVVRGEASGERDVQYLSNSFSTEVRDSVEHRKTTSSPHVDPAKEGWESEGTSPYLRQKGEGGTLTLHVNVSKVDFSGKNQADDRCGWA